MAANPAIARERTVSIKFTPLLINDVRCIVVVGDSFFNTRDESLVFIELVYTELINSLRRRS